MKYSLFVVGFLTLTPCLVYAQNQQFSDCRTLEMAGSFIGPDEALVDGLVCRVGKPKTSVSASRPAAEESKALLGIIEPDILRSKEKAEARGTEATPEAAPRSVPMDSRPGGAAGPSSSFVTPKQSLGDIARAFRKDSSAEVTAKPDERALEGAKPAREEVDRVATVSETDKTPTKGTPGEPLPARPSEVSPVPERAAGREAGTMAKAPAVLRASPEEAPGTAKSEVIAVPQAQPGAIRQAANPAAARDRSAVKPDRSFPAVGAKSSSAPDLQPAAEDAPPASIERAPNEPIRASPAPRATVDAPELKPERLSAPAVIATSSRARTESRTELQASGMELEEDFPFRQGQSPNCNKNVSLGSLDKDKLFLAIPDWAFEWYEKNQKRFPGICFSDSLMPGAKNYLVVFQAPGTESLAKVSSSGETSSGSGTGAFTASYGSTWHYIYEHAVTTTIVSVSAEKAPHNQPSSLLYATAYSEQGTPVCHHAAPPGATRVKETSHNRAKGPDAEVPEFRVMEELLRHMMEDIAKL